MHWHILGVMSFPLSSPLPGPLLGVKFRGHTFPHPLHSTLTYTKRTEAHTKTTMGAGQSSAARRKKAHSMAILPRYAPPLFPPPLPCPIALFPFFQFIPSLPLPAQTRMQSSVAGDLVRSADIVINSSRKDTHTLDADKTTKAQRFAKSVGELDEIVAWLDWEFAKHDNNKDGFLDYHEFVHFIRSLNLNMSTKEVGCCWCGSVWLCRSHLSPLPPPSCDCALLFRLSLLLPILPPSRRSSNSSSSPTATTTTASSGARSSRTCLGF